MRTIKSLFVVAGVTTIALAALSANAHATTITQVLNVPGGSNALTSIVSNIPYNLFDSTLGTLNSVTLELVTTDTVNANVFNSNGTPGAITGLTASFPLTIYGPPATLSAPFDLTTYLATSTITAGPFSGTAAPFSQTTIGSSTGTTDSGVVNVPALDWNGNWETPGGGGSATDIVFASGSGQFAGGGPSGVFVGGNATVTGTLTLIYNYTPRGPYRNAGARNMGSCFASASVSLAGLRRRRARK